MRKRTFAAFAVAVVVCAALPSVAMAKEAVKLNGFASTHTVIRGNNLRELGTITSDPNAAHWNRHSVVRVQRKLDGVWRTLVRVRPTEKGNISFALTKPKAGSYRLWYPGCDHYRSKTREFTIKIRDTKYDPKLAVGAPSFFRILQPTALNWMMLQAPVTSGVSADKLVGGYLLTRSYGSTNGVDYYETYALENPFSFGGSNAVTVAPVPVNPWNGDTYVMYTHFKVRVNWSGNAFTKSASVLSTAMAPVQ
ncbi:MAG: hypothetical protein HGB10_02300 [Coriobacteriia bacterium]|nr:hypothetical protein [Coriobacteriia bacterium]